MIICTENKQVSNSNTENTNEDIIIGMAKDYSSYLAYALVKENYIDSTNMEDVKNDLFAEFYICGKNCEKKFIDGYGAQFTTYLHSAFQNLRNGIYNKYNEKRKYETSLTTDEDEKPIDMPIYDNDYIEYNEETKYILSQFTGLELLIIKEILIPSEKIEQAMYAYCAKFKNHNISDNMMPQYIKAAYNIPQHIFTRCMNNIKKKVKKHC